MRNLCVKVQMKTFYLDNYSKYSTFSLKIIFRLLRAKYTSRLNRKSKKKDISTYTSIETRSIKEIKLKKKKFYPS